MFVGAFVGVLSGCCPLRLRKNLALRLRKNVALVIWRDFVLISDGRDPKTVYAELTKA